MCQRILIVEQCQAMADRIALLLEKLGHQVRIARDLEAALVVAQNFCPQVVLVDPTLPDIGTCQAAMGLRSVLIDERLRIIAMDLMH